MAPKLQPIRGTKDILFDDMRAHEHIVATAKEIASRFGFETMSTPIMEPAEVFKRTLGEESDIVSKEMYSFLDRGNESVTLRPEFTASICRSFISEGLSQHTPCKFFSHGPLFRYERPQKGRYRQFHQVNFELLGAAEPLADAEMISMAALLLRTLGIEEMVTLELNSLGDRASREQYRTALVNYYQKHQSSLSEDSKRRLGTNPMRILDSKDEGDKQINQNAPLLTEYLSEEAVTFWHSLTGYLDQLGIRYQHNPKLVRGLDYYAHTVFEFTTNQLGSQNTVCAGGRYNHLIDQMGGPETPSVGFAAGIERLALLLAEQGKSFAKPRPIVVIPIGAEAEANAVSLCFELRTRGLIVETHYSGNAGKRFKRAHKQNAICCVTFGEDELKQNIYKVKMMDSGDEKDIAASQLIDILTSVSL